MVRVENIIDLVERDGEPLHDGSEIIVKSHWNDKDKVVLNIDRKEYTVYASDLKKAIENAVNAHDF